MYEVRFSEDPVLKIEYQDTELAFYTMEWEEDNKHIKEVKNPRVIETG